MANFDILCFLEYYADRTSVLDGSGNRSATNQWQNFYQDPQTLSVDSESTGSYEFLAFDVNGFGSNEGGEINDLSISVAATGAIIDLTDAAMNADNLIIASLYVQDVGSASLDVSSAQLVSRYYGAISAAVIRDESIDWTVNPAINKIKAQVPFRVIDTDLIGRFNLL